VSVPGLDPRIAWARAASRYTDLPRSVRHVALALATCLNFGLTGSAPLTELMLATGYGRLAVLRGLRALRENEWIDIAQHHSPGHATVYKAEIPALFRVEQVSPQIPVHPDEVSQVSPQAPLFKRASTTNVRTGLLLSAVPVDNSAHEDVVDGVLVRLSSTRVYPVSGRSTNGLREVISQRIAAGYTAESLVVWADGVTFKVLNPAGLLAKEFSLERQTTPQGPARPTWCGKCKSSENRILVDADGDEISNEGGFITRCPVCNPLSFAVAMAR
jgi:hypothetical protein